MTVELFAVAVVMARVVIRGRHGTGKVLIDNPVSSDTFAASAKAPHVVAPR